MVNHPLEMECAATTAFFCLRWFAYFLPWVPVNHHSTSIWSMGFSGTPKDMGSPYGKRDPYYSHTTSIIPKDMGIVWEAYHKGVPLLGVPGITLDLGIFSNHPTKQIQIFWKESPKVLIKVPLLRVLSWHMFFHSFAPITFQTWSSTRNTIKFCQFVKDKKTPQTLTVPEANIAPETSVFRGYVSFREGILKKHLYNMLKKHWTSKRHPTPTKIPLHSAN